MQSHLIRSETEIESEATVEKIHQLLEGRNFSCLSPLITVDVLREPQGGIEGEYSAPYWKVEVSIHDLLPLPLGWPMNSVVLGKGSIVFADETQLAAVAEPWRKVPTWKLKTIAEVLGIYGDILTIIEAMPEGISKIMARNAVTQSPELSIDSPLLNELWPLLGRTEEDKINLFKAAYDVSG